MSKLIEEVKAKRTELKKKQEELLKEVRLAFNECVSGLFEKHKNLVSFSWTQYTPYFNDGDTCYFSSNHGYPEYTYINEEGEEVSCDENYGEGEENEEISNDISEVLGLFEDEEYETFFGDHVKVTVTKSGVETEEYDHD